MSRKHYEAGIDHEKWKPGRVIAFQRHEYGHLFEIEVQAIPDKKGRYIRLYDNGTPAFGGQYHYNIENAMERAEYILVRDYMSKIHYLEQRVQTLEAQNYILSRR